MLKAKRVWRVVRGDRAARSMTQEEDMATMVAEAGVITDEYLARDFVCSLILQGLGEIPSSCVMVHQDDPWKGWEIIRQQHSASLTFSKATVRSSLAQTRYTG